jgi:two-component system, cell cycle response regulator
MAMRERAVLVIEDDPLNRKLVHALLSIGGYKVLEAGNVEEGLAVAREKSPDCILMDVRLPGTDALSAMRLLKQDHDLKTIPVIALTDFATSGDEQKAREAGFDAYVSKPIDSAHFIGTVTKLLQGKRNPGEATRSRVLIVDDEPMSIKVLSAQLHKEGWETEGVSGGEEAIRRARESSPDLILMDVLMPGINGYEATRRLKGDPATMHIPIILVTGLSDVQDKLDGLEAGADEFLSKPVNTAELTVRIKNILKLRQYEEQLMNRALSHDLSVVRHGSDVLGRAQTASSRILLLDGADRERSIFRDHLEELGHRVSAFGSGEEKLLAEHERTTDIVILDAELPGVDTFEICRRLKQEGAVRRTPLVVIAGKDDPEGRIRYLSIGADDLLPRPVDHRELAARVGRLLRQQAYFDSLQSRYASALLASNNDGLTELFNSTYFKRFLDLEIKRSQRKNHPTSLVMLDLDDFKSKNDTLGHPAGDLILIEVGRRIRGSLRDIDLPALYGGEEFAIVLPYTDGPGAVVVAERIRAALEGRSFLQGTAYSPVQVTASIGVATCPEHGKASGELIRAADTMLYQAKEKGKNRVCHMGS